MPVIYLDSAYGGILTIKQARFEEFFGSIATSGLEARHKENLDILLEENPYLRHLMHESLPTYGMRTTMLRLVKMYNPELVHAEKQADGRAFAYWQFSRHGLFGDLPVTMAIARLLRECDSRWCLYGFGVHENKNAVFVVGELNYTDTTALQVGRFPPPFTIIGSPGRHFGVGRMVDELEEIHGHRHGPHQHGSMIGTMVNTYVHTSVQDNGRSPRPEPPAIDRPPSRNTRHSGTTRDHRLGHDDTDDDDAEYFSTEPEDEFDDATVPRRRTRPPPSNEPSSDEEDDSEYGLGGGGPRTHRHSDGQTIRHHASDGRGAGSERRRNEDADDVPPPAYEELEEGTSTTRRMRRSGGGGRSGL